VIAPNTEVRLLSGVPFNHSYEHTRYFENKDDQTAYFLDKVQYSYLELTYQREERAVMVPAAYDSLYLCNYLMYRNTAFGTKWFYAFITHKEYVNPNNTRVYFELDVFQTWLFEMKWKPSYIVREHRDRWNADGTPVLNTVDEELAYGTEYDNVDVTNFTPFDGYKWLVILSKMPMHTGMTKRVEPSVVGTPTPLSVYLVPFKDNNTVPNVVDTTGNGVVISKPTDVLRGLYYIEDAVNNVVSLYITDFPGVPVSYSGGVFTFDASRCSVLPAQVKDPDTSQYFNCLYVQNVSQFDELIHDFGSKYDGFHPVTESKLLMHPYTQLVLADFKGNHAEFKTEYIQNANLQVVVKGSLGTSNKNSYGIKNYNYVMDETGDAMSDETALINNEPNDLPIITDLLSAYIQGNRNALANQKASIQFNGYMGMASGALNAITTAMMPGMEMMAGNGILEEAKSAGNMMLQIQALNAKQMDIKNTPPNITKQGSNTSYTIGNGYDGVYIIKKQIKPEYIKKLTDFFYLYGYKVNELKMPNLHTRTAFNFVQTAGANLTGNIPNRDLDKIKSVFDKGLTLWHTDDMLNFSLANGEL
jgi:hypothetical protein